MKALKNLALAVPPIRHMYEELLSANKKLSLNNIELSSLQNENLNLRNNLKSDDIDEQAFPKKFYHYNALFNPISLINKYAVGGQSSEPGFVINAFGVKIDVRFLPTVLANLSGVIERPPIPANWHADIAEFGAALRAVDLASDSFTVVELGCGWGCWTNITGVVARRAGKRVRLIGIEGDAGHVAFARSAYRDNGFEESDYELIHGIAGATRGRAYFPKDDQSGIDWGKAPVFLGEGETLNANENYAELPVIAITDIAQSAGRIDLLHIDIQGGEADLLSESLHDISSRVSYICVGTHSREIEGQIIASMAGSDWKLEIERPAIYVDLGGNLVLQVDGVQGWRNTTLLP